MYRLPWVFFGVTESTILIVDQVSAIPDNLIMLLVNLPIVVLVVWLQLQNQKWLEHMLEIQRNSLKSVYEGQNQFLNLLIAQIENKQNEMIGTISDLVKSSEMVRGTVAEVAKVDDVIDRLLLEIRRDKNE